MLNKQNLFEVKHVWCCCNTKECDVSDRGTNGWLAEGVFERSRQWKKVSL